MSDYILTEEQAQEECVPGKIIMLPRIIDSWRHVRPPRCNKCGRPLALKFKMSPMWTYPDSVRYIWIHNAEPTHELCSLSPPTTPASRLIRSDILKLVRSINDHCHGTWSHQNPRLPGDER